MDEYLVWIGEPGWFISEVVIWAKHGVGARSDTSVKRASDRVDYAETAANYEYLNMVAGDHGEGLNVGKTLAICKAFNIQQTIF